MSEEAPGFGPDAIETMMRERIRATIEALIDEELEAALGAAKSQRIGVARSGYRHGSRPRQLTTSLGRTRIAMPRARLIDPDGSSRESKSSMRLKPVSGWFIGRRRLTSCG